jgi:hypothetical protein
MAEGNIPEIPPKQRPKGRRHMLRSQWWALQGQVILAMAGQVFVRVCSQTGAIAPGDLLVASDSPGVA